MSVVFVRTTKKLHETLREQAKREKVSMNALAAKILEEGLKTKK